MFLRKRGFTLIELMIVMSIIAILATVLMPNIIKIRASAAISACNSTMKNIAVSIESYNADTGKKLSCGGGIYPFDRGTSCTDLANVIEESWARIPTCPVNRGKPYAYVDSTNYYIYCPSMATTPYGSGLDGVAHYFSQKGSPLRALYYSEASGPGYISVP